MGIIKKYRIQIFLILLICVFSIAITGYFVVNQTPEHLIKKEPPLLVCGNATEKTMTEKRFLTHIMQVATYKTTK